MLNSLFPLLCLLPLLALCLVQDLRTRRVPNRLTLPALAAGAAATAARGEWTLVLLAAGLAGLAEAPRRGGTAAGSALLAAAVLVQPRQAAACAALWAAWLLWQAGGWGGADLKLAWALLLAAGTPAVLTWIALCGGVQGLAAVLRRERTVPFVASIVSGAVLFGVSSVI